MTRRLYGAKAEDVLNFLGEWLRRMDQEFMASDQDQDGPIWSQRRFVADAMNRVKVSFALVVYLKEINAVDDFADWYAEKGEEEAEGYEDYSEARAKRIERGDS